MFFYRRFQKKEFIMYFISLAEKTYLTLLIPGLFGARQYRGGGADSPPPPPPLHNFSISYAFALKLVTGVHLRLVNTLVKKKI